MTGFLIKWVISTNEKEKAEFKKHIDTCNETPKVLILEKIENLSNKMDEHHEASSKSIDTISKNFNKMEFRYSKLEDRVERLERRKP